MNYSDGIFKFRFLEFNNLRILKIEKECRSKRMSITYLICLRSITIIPCDDNKHVICFMFEFSDLSILYNQLYLISVLNL